MGTSTRTSLLSLHSHGRGKHCYGKCRQRFRPLFSFFLFLFGSNHSLHAVGITVAWTSKHAPMRVCGRPNVLMTAKNRVCMTHPRRRSKTHVAEQKRCIKIQLTMVTGLELMLSRPASSSILACGDRSPDRQQILR